MTTPTLPKDVADPERLSAALRRSGALGRGRVVQVVVETSFATVLSQIFRLRLAFEGADASAPASLIVKAGLVERSGGPWMGGRHEVAFYDKVASATPQGLLPRCFDASWDADSGAWHLLLEDLTESHLVATRWPLPPTQEQCERIVRTRARFHAAWWDAPGLGETVGNWQDTADQSVARVAADFERFAAELGDRLSPHRRAFYARLLDAAPRLLARLGAHRQMTVIQGDAHVWNCFLPRSGTLDGARLFDWDAWRLGIGADDLAYMMAIHWYPELRRRIESRLLDGYHDELVACGVRDYDRRALQDDYRLAVLWQTTTPIWQCVYGIPPVIWWNNLERVHLAVDDLDCRAMLAD